MGARSASQRNDFTSPARQTEAWRAQSLSPAGLRDQGSQLRGTGTRRQNVSSIFNYKWRTFFMPSPLVIPRQLITPSNTEKFKFTRTEICWTSVVGTPPTSHVCPLSSCKMEPLPKPHITEPPPSTHAPRQKPKD